MKLVLSDIERNRLNISGENLVIENNGNIHQCAGCFGCWIKTPGKCVISDGYEEMGRLLGGCTQLIIISRCVYGSVSPFIKNVLDRAISYVHPQFCYRRGEMHHKHRYDNKITISAYFYGKGTTEAEKETARRLIRANAVNFDGDVGQIVFLTDEEEVEGLRL